MIRAFLSPTSLRLIALSIGSPPVVAAEVPSFVGHISAGKIAVISDGDFRRPDYVHGSACAARGRLPRFADNSLDRRWQSHHRHDTDFQFRYRSAGDPPTDGRRADRLRHRTTGRTSRGRSNATGPAARTSVSSLSTFPTLQHLIWLTPWRSPPFPKACRSARTDAASPSCLTRPRRASSRSLAIRWPLRPVALIQPFRAGTSPDRHPPSRRRDGHQYPLASVRPLPGRQHQHAEQGRLLRGDGNQRRATSRLWGNIVEVGIDPFVGRFTPDGRYYLTSNWGRNFRRNRPRRAYPADALDDQRHPASRSSDHCAETHTTSASARPRPTSPPRASPSVRMAGLWLPSIFAAQPFRPIRTLPARGSVTLLTFDPATGAITKVADYPFEGSCPKVAPSIAPATTSWQPCSMDMWTRGRLRPLGLRSSAS